MNVNYIPQPVDFSDIDLPADIEAATEIIARNVHEVWAKSRIEQGWTYGPERNDELRHHPSLIPYEKLSEEEKDYDRNTAKGTLKMLLKMGYRITKE